MTASVCESDEAKGDIAMPTVQVPAQLSVKHLMAAVKQLSPDELHEFTQQFTVWQEQHSEQGVRKRHCLPSLGKTLAYRPLNGDVTSGYARNVNAKL
jgi:hypothetical protein